MGLLDRLFGRGERAPETIEGMVVQARSLIKRDDYTGAMALCQRVLQREPENDGALCCLGGLYARGDGVAQDDIVAAGYFRRAALSGNDRAAKECEKCERRFVEDGLMQKAPGEVYSRAAHFARTIYGETDGKGYAGEKLCDLAILSMKKRDYGKAARLLRASAEFGGYPMARNLLAVMYNAGKGVPHNDLAALYWFDLAADDGVEDAAVDRDGILNGYRENCSPDEFSEQMGRLASWCAKGSADVPMDPEKAAHWRKVAAPADEEGETMDEKKEFEPDPEAAVEWSREINGIVRLAFCGVIYRADGCYHIRMRDGDLVLEDIHTLVDVYLYVHNADEAFRREIDALYAGAWSITHIMELVDEPQKHRPEMLAVVERMREELHEISQRPSVPPEDFAICPRRSALMAMAVAEKDLKNVL